MVPTNIEELAEPGKLEAMVDGVTDMFARLCRCSEGLDLIRPSTGGVYSEIQTPPSFRCKGCNVLMQTTRWLCHTCRSQRLTVKSKKSYIACAYEGKLVSAQLREGGDKWQASVLLEMQLSEAHAVLKLTERCATIARGLVVNHGPRFNVSLHNMAVDVYAGWTRPLGTDGSDEWYLPSFGAATRVSVEEEARRWLERLDSAIAKTFDLQVAPECWDEQARLKTIREELALLLAARMTMSEHAETHKRFSTHKLELINKLEFVAVDISAPAEAEADRSAVCLLECALRQALEIITSEGNGDSPEMSTTSYSPEEDGLLQLEQTPLRFAALLSADTAPPELDLSMCLSAFPGALSNLQILLSTADNGDQLLANLFVWIQNFHQIAEMLTYALVAAKGRIEEWLVAKRSTPNYFVQTIKIRKDRMPSEGSMPIPGWFEMSFSADIYKPLGPTGVTRRRRFGLSCASERIVRLASVLWQLEGEGAFGKPVMHASFLFDISEAHNQRALSSCGTLVQRSCVNELGQLYERTHKSMVQQDVMVEDDIRGALASMGQFSLKEIATFFSLVVPKYKHAIAERSVGRLPEIASQPCAAYRDFVDDLLPIASLLLKTQRMAYRETISVRLSAPAELLRSIRRIRLLEEEGQLAETSELVLDYGEDLKKRSAGRDFLEHCARQLLLCRVARIGKKERIVINTFDLLKILAASPRPQEANPQHS